MKIKYLIFYTSIAVSLIVTSACKKDKSKPCSCNESGDRIVKITTIWYDGSISTENLYYDEYQRLVNISNSENNSAYINIAYDNVGRISKKTAYVNEEIIWYWDYKWANDSLTATEFFKYSNGELLERRKNTFEFDDNSQIIKIELFYINHIGEWVINYSSLWENGNIVIQKEYNENNFEISSTTFQYEDKPNPFDKYYDFYFPKMTKNMMLKAICTYPDGRIKEKTEYTYEYNNNGFPTMIKEKTCSENTSETTLILEYNCLR
jgi:hypothetical protein